MHDDGMGNSWGIDLVVNEDCRDGWSRVRVGSARVFFW